MSGLSDNSKLFFTISSCAAIPGYPRYFFAVQASPFFDEAITQFHTLDQMLLDGADSNTQMFGDLFVRQSMHLTQQIGLAALRGQLGHRFAKQSQGLLGDEFILGGTFRWYNF